MVCRAGQPGGCAFCRDPVDLADDDGCDQHLAHLDEVTGCGNLASAIRDVRLHVFEVNGHRNRQQRDWAGSSPYTRILLYRNTRIGQ